MSLANAMLGALAANPNLNRNRNRFNQDIKYGDRLKFKHDNGTIMVAKVYEICSKEEGMERYLNEMKTTSCYYPYTTLSLCNEKGHTVACIGIENIICKVK